jgi:seryl-tRNA synthetase
MVATCRHYCHTLNGTAMAVPRIIVALLETHQSESGDVTVPNALRPYLGGMDTIRPIAEQGAGS